MTLFTQCKCTFKYQCGSVSLWLCPPPSVLGWTYSVRLQKCCLISTHTVRVSRLQSKAKANVLTLSGSIVKPQLERSHCTCDKVTSAPAV